MLQLKREAGDGGDYMMVAIIDLARHGKRGFEPDAYDISRSELRRLRQMTQAGAVKEIARVINENGGAEEYPAAGSSFTRRHE